MAVASSLVSLLSLVAIYGILAIGLNIKFGYTGLLDIGHAAFYLIGAYTTALLVSPPAATYEYAVYILGWNWPWLPALVAGMVVAGIAGVFVSLPAIRLREDYLAIVTLGISIIVMRIVQTESWLANGPDSLSSFDLPMRNLMPLPGSTIGSVLLLAFVVFVFYAGMTYGIASLFTRTGFADSFGRISHGLLAVTSLGLGYLAGRYARGEDAPSPAQLAVVAGGITGVAAAVMSTLGDDFGQVALLLFLGATSVFSWVFATVLVVRYVRPFSRRSLATSLGIALWFVLSLAPGVLSPSLLGVAGSLAVFVAFVVVVQRIGVGWEDSGSQVAFLHVLGASAVWLFVVRYFFLSITGPLSSGNVTRVVFDTIQNVLWLIQFTPSGIAFDYSRLMLVGFAAALGIVYVVSQQIVKSPYGRVLKAIREDEQVAASLGKDTFTYKVQSMALGGAIAGLAGGLTAIFFRTLTYQMFHPRVTFFVLLIVIIGGMANNRGMILGALVYWGFQQGTTDIAALFPSGGMRTRVQAIRLALFGLMFVALLYYKPEGLLPERLTSKEPENE